MNPTAPPRPRPTKPAGWIYLIHTWDDPAKYGGQTTQPVWTRVNAHRKDKPWGRDIKPGREGYTILRRVDSVGDPVADAILLDLAEAEEIARWMPSENANRPDPAVFRRRLAAHHGGHPTASPTGHPMPAFLGQRMDFDGRPTGPTPRAPQTTPRRRPAPRQVPWRAVLFVVLALPCAVITARVAGTFPDPTIPWVATPVGAFLGPVLIVSAVRRAFRAPRRRRRRRRH